MAREYFLKSLKIGSNKSFCVLWLKVSQAPFTMKFRQNNSDEWLHCCDFETVSPAAVVFFYKPTDSNNCLCRMSEIGNYEVKFMVCSHHVYRVRMYHSENYMLQAVSSSPGRISLSMTFTTSLAAAMVEASTAVNSELFGLGRTELVLSK